jgi:hypothetical protein
MFMSETAVPSLADRFAITFEGMREAMAADAARKGPTGALLRAILSLLERIVALLAEFRAGTLVAAAPRRAAPGADATREASATSAARATCAASAGRAGEREPPPPFAQTSPDRSELGGAGRCGSADPASPPAAASPEREQVAKPIDLTGRSPMACADLVRPGRNAHPSDIGPLTTIPFGRPRWPPDRDRR